VLGRRSPEWLVPLRPYPPGAVLPTLRQSKRASVRERDLPAHVVVCYVIAWALYMRSSDREVRRCWLEGVPWLLDPSAAVKVAGKSGISQARGRLGPEPLKKLYEVVVAPIAERRTQGPGIVSGDWSAWTAAPWTPPTQRKTKRLLGGRAPVAAPALSPGFD
jgi:hypothetical protein